MESGGVVLLADAVTVYVTDRRDRGEISDRTAEQLAWRLGTLAACHPGLDLADLGKDQVLVWQRSTGWQRPASRRAYLSTLRVFCAWAVDAGLLERDPTVRLARIREPRPAPRALSDGQYRRLVLVLPDDRARLIVGLMRHSGLRCVEVSRLEVGDYDSQTGEMHVVGKADQARTVPVFDDEQILLARRLAGRLSGPVIGVSAPWISRLVSAWMSQAGIKTRARDGRSAHALRHTAASRMADVADVRLVQEFLGHASLATTDRYVRRGSMAAMKAAQRASA